MNTILANDIINQLQTHINSPAWDETGKLEVGVKTEKLGWDKIKDNVFYRTEVVTIGNSDYIVMALRSYNTVIGFIWNDVLYSVGKYSTSTSRHLNCLKEKLSNYFSDEQYFEKRKA